MAESIPADETPNQKQARLRRERRNAKIQAGGSARLAAITSMSGRPAPAPEDAPTASVTPGKTNSTSTDSPSASRALQATAQDDPDEVDISQHHYTPRNTSRPLTPSTFSPFGPPPPPGSNPFAAPPGGQNPMADDPQMRMLQQMLGGFDPNNPQAGMGNMPDFAQMMAAMGGAGPGAAGEQAPVKSSAYLWRVVHAVFSFGLAVYVASITTFTGSRVDRERRAAVDVWGDETSLEQGFGKRLFYLFATAEVLLQSSRFFLERGQLQQGGMLATISQILPAPFGGYVRVAGRYSVIYTTVVADAMVIVFVLGMVSWWKSAVA